MVGEETPMLQSWMATTWPRILQGRGEDERALQARNELLMRYHEAVYHYFLRTIRDPHAAQELYSNFALRLIESDALIRRADPQRGRFRSYLKTALHNMVIDYYRKQARERRVQPLSLDPATHDVPDQDDNTFSPVWRQELLNQAWKALEQSDRKSGQSFYVVLRFQSEHPELKAPQLAEQLGPRLGKSLTAEAVRQILHRGREKFAELLLAEVERSLEEPTLDELEQELVELQLLAVCRKAIDKRRAGETA
jgi:RNA polymerase sigma-70 factor (ECF subfamily)